MSLGRCRCLARMKTCVYRHQPWFSITWGHFRQEGGGGKHFREGNCRNKPRRTRAGKPRFTYSYDTAVALYWSSPMCRTLKLECHVSGPVIGQGVSTPQYLKRVFAILYQILLGWKQYEYYYETVELPNPRPTQPKKKIG